MRNEAFEFELEFKIAVRGVKGERSSHRPNQTQKPIPVPITLAEVAEFVEVAILKRDGDHHCD